MIFEGVEITMEDPVLFSDRFGGKNQSSSKISMFLLVITDPPQTKKTSSVSRFDWKIPWVVEHR